MKPNLYAAQNSGQKAWNRLFDRSACPEDLLLLAKADHRGRTNAAPYAETERTIRARLSAYEEMMARPHITGADLLARGIQPGEEMGRLLEEAHRLRLAGVKKRRTRCGRCACETGDDSFRHAFGVPTFGVFHRLNPPQAATMENVPRRGRSWGGLENGVAEERRDTVSLPYNHKLIPRAKELRKDATEQEKSLWYKYLSQYPIRFQRQKTIGRFIADFYCAKAKLAIELNRQPAFFERRKGI